MWSNQLNLLQQSVVDRDLNYQGTDAQKKRRAMRNKARRLMIKSGRATKGDGKETL